MLVCDRVIVLDPFNTTRATVAEVKRALNATVLMYWDTNDMIVNHTGECLRKKGTGQVEGECGGLDGAGEPKTCSTGHYMCCDRFDCPYSKAPMCGPDAFPDAFAKVFNPAWAVRELPGKCVNATCPAHQPHSYWGRPGQSEGGTYCCPTPVKHGEDCPVTTCQNGSTSTDCACCLVAGSKTGCDGAPKCSGVPAIPPGSKICDKKEPMPQCLYFFGLSFVPFEEAVAAIGNFLAGWLKDKGYDGVYLDEYFSPTLFDRLFFEAPGFYANMSLDVNGDGQVDSPAEIKSQYKQWRNGVTAILRQKLGPEAVMIANTAGEGADPNLNGITLESEACGSFEACRGWLSDQEKIGAKPPVSAIWTCDATTPAAKAAQCANAARYQDNMSWVQIGSAWWGGNRVLCE